MNQEEFKCRLIESTKKLIVHAQSMVTNSISEHVEFLIEPNNRNTSTHLNDRELEKLNKLNQLEGQQFDAEQVANILFDSGLVPLWIDTEISQSSKNRTTVTLICSRRFRKEEDLNDKVAAFPPFHPMVPMPPWYKEGEKFNINWKQHGLKMKWHSLTWKWKHKRHMKKQQP